MTCLIVQASRMRFLDLSLSFHPWESLLAKQPVHASLSFLLTLLSLSSLYLQLSAQFIAVMQILVYAGAILVLFMFVIVLFPGCPSIL